MVSDFRNLYVGASRDRACIVYKINKIRFIKDNKKATVLHDSRF